MNQPPYVQIVEMQKLRAAIYLLTAALCFGFAGVPSWLIGLLGLLTGLRFLYLVTDAVYRSFAPRP